ncbi:MAG: copper resistance CopC family protein [Gemmatimonadaceae bacterium]
MLRFLSAIRTTHSSVARGLRRTASLAAGIAVLGTAAFMPASAVPHISLVSSTPAKDAHVMTAPREIRLTFSGNIDVTKASLTLTAADGRTVTLDSLRAVVDSPKVAVAIITGKLASGTYTAKWNAVAADGAKGSGDFSFMNMSMMKPE